MFPYLANYILAICMLYASPNDCCKLKGKFLTNAALKITSIWQSWISNPCRLMCAEIWHYFQLFFDKPQLCRTEIIISRHAQNFNVLILIS